MANITDYPMAIAADTVDDLERTRIALQNRVRQMTRTEPDADGVVRGFGFTEDYYAVASVNAIVESLSQQEKTAVKILEKMMKEHVLGKWVQGQKGVGLKQGARLIAAIGDPYWNTLHNRPRTVTELWSYCGFGVNDEGTAVKRKKGVQSNWNANAKMRAYLIAESCLKQKGSPYELVYRARRAHTDETHPEWSAGRSHNDALRMGAKALLRDMWIATKEIHEKETNV